MQRPQNRPRRLRKGELIRDFVADVRLTSDDFIMPLFLKNGENIRNPVSSMPGVSQISPDVALEEIQKLSDRGVKHYLLFGVIDADDKDEVGSPALDDNNPVNVTMRAVREKGLAANMIADLCYCEYTSHGHCGILSKDEEETVDNDQSLEILAQQAQVLARNGADIVAPSCMMDGMISAIREGLDQIGFNNTPILSYSTKFASNMYGPFRDAADGAPSFGNRKSYQMDFRRAKEWETETVLDIEEGADMLMIKPGMPYLDILTQVKALTSVPVGVYHVSGEYSMLCAAAEKDWLDLKACAVEAMYSFKRAGADFIITYFADRLPEWIK